MVWMMLHDVLFADIVRKDEICSEIITLDVHGVAITVRQRKIFQRTKKRSPDAEIHQIVYQESELCGHT